MNGDLEGYPFQVLFAADAKDNVKITVRWPNDVPNVQSVRTVALMLHHISSGHWMPPMVASVRKHGVDSKQIDVSTEILREWSQATQIQVSDQVCVGPRQVFGRKTSEQD